MLHRIILIFFSFIFFLALTGCNLFNNDNTKEKEYVPVDRDYILINTTPHDNLKLYLSLNQNDSCTSLTQISIINKGQTFPFHVSKSQTVWIYYCTQTDNFCSGCRKKELKGESTWQKNVNLN
jgi:hypothetical protein